MSLFDENAEILRNIRAHGGDFETPRSVDFAHVFPDKLSADAFAQRATQEGFSVGETPSQHQEDGSWDVTASKAMLPTCENITNTEERLDAFARLRSGRADGWGFFGL